MDKAADIESNSIIDEIKDVFGDELSPRDRLSLGQATHHALK